MYNDEFNQYHYSRGSVPQDDYRRSVYADTAPVQDAGPEVRPPRKKRTALKIVALVLVCALLGGGCGFGGAYLAGKLKKPTSSVVQQSNREPVEITVKAVDGHTLMTPAEVYAAAVNSVVSINSSTTSYNVFGQVSESASSGTGFIITEDGYIVTNQHVVEDADSVSVTLYDGTTYDATIIGGDSDYDVAVIKIETTGLPVVTLGKSDTVNVGDTVLAIGNPLGELTFSMSQGIVSCCDRAINVDGNPFTMIQVDCSINPGNSGGPLMNLYGEVVGIVSAKYSSYSNTTVEGLGFAIPISDVQAIITDIMENGAITDKAYLAITAGTMTESLAAQFDLKVQTGVLVYSVAEGGAGDKAGLEKLDVITAIDDKKIGSMEELSAAKKGYRAGDTAKLSVNRDGEELELTITFDSQPQTTGEETQEQTPQQQTPYGQNPYGNYNMDDLFRYFFGNGGYGFGG